MEHLVVHVKKGLKRTALFLFVFCVSAFLITVVIKMRDGIVWIGTQMPILIGEGNARWFEAALIAGAVLLALYLLWPSNLWPKKKKL